MYEAIPLADFRDEFRNYLGCWQTIVFSGVAINEGQHLSPAAVYILAGRRLKVRTEFIESPGVPDGICLFKMVRGTATARRMLDQIIGQESWQVDGKTISFAQFELAEAAFLTSGEETAHYPYFILKEHLGIGPKLLLAGSFANREYLYNDFRIPVQQEFQKADYLYHSLEHATSHLIGIMIGFREHFGRLFGVLDIPIRLEAHMNDTRLIWRLDLPANLKEMPREMRYIRQSTVGLRDKVMPMGAGKQQGDYMKFRSSVNLMPHEEAREVVLLLGGKRVASAEVPRKEVVQKKQVVEQIEALPEALIGEKGFPRLVETIQPPTEIQQSLARFKQDYPNPEKVAFIMMKFGETEAHKEIVGAIRKGLAEHDIIGVRADDKEYHADLLYNVMTYLYGCGFGVAVFERIEEEEFSPNAALEVGYMFALAKPVCLLKDKTLKALHTDILSKIYRPFDTQHPTATIPTVLSEWLLDKGLAQANL